METYDLVIIGGGPGGYEAAFAAAAYGMKTAIIEKDHLGGTCLNHGCIPTKILLHAAGVIETARQAENIGIEISDLKLNMKKLQAHKWQIIEKLRAGIAMRLKKDKITVYKGEARLETANKICISSDADIQAIHAEKILIAAGAVPAMLPIPGIKLPGVITSNELLELEDIPKQLVIVGGGVIGVEFASLYATLGSRVTLIEALDRILANMDKELSQSVKMLLKKQGVEIHTSAKVEKIETASDGLICSYIEKDQKLAAKGGLLLLAVGRKSAGAEIFMPGFSLPVLENGKIIVDENYRTSCENIYAIGDVTGGIQLAHAAAAEGRNAAAIIAGRKPLIDTRTVPSCIYTEPEIASVGLTVEEAKQAGRDIISKKYSMGANGKSVLSGTERGYMRIVADAKTHKLLGAHLMCARASDIISEFTSAIVQGHTLEDMAAVIRPHPTFSEAVSEVVNME